MTEPCTKEVEIALLTERLNKLDEIHRILVGDNGDGLKGKVKSALVQLKFQWCLMAVLLGLIAWVLRA